MKTIDILDAKNKSIMKEIYTDSVIIPPIFKNATNTKKMPNNKVFKNDMYIQISKSKWKNARTGEVIKWIS